MHCCCMQVRQWNIWGLPKDDFSTDNAVAITSGVRLRRGSRSHIQRVAAKPLC